MRIINKHFQIKGSLSVVHYMNIHQHKIVTSFTCLMQNDVVLLLRMAHLHVSA